jgi:hypothetical protein
VAVVWTESKIEHSDRENNQQQYDDERHLENQSFPLERIRDQANAPKE